MLDVMNKYENCMCKQMFDKKNVKNNSITKLHLKYLIQRNNDTKPKKSIKHEKYNI